MVNTWYLIKTHFGSVFPLTDLEPIVNLPVSHLAFQPSHFLILATKGESGFPPLNQPGQSQKWTLPCELLVKASKHYSRRKSTAFTFEMEYCYYVMPYYALKIVYSIL